jgi:hypothetical protein
MLRRHAFRWGVLCLLVVIPIGVAHFTGKLWSAMAVQDTPKPFEKVPEGQTFVGTKVCGSCHFDQLLDWKKTKHAKGFEILPMKYREDKSCLKCHTTGLGDPTGFKSVAETPELIGASCESCHGPGSKHAELSKKYFGKKPTPEEEKYLRSSIHKMQPRNVCVECHNTRAHKKHPDYDK